jgi:hypothetical protein
MLEALSLLVMLMMSLIINRVATVALTLTGMSLPAARFQARSALTGAGFTTAESERVVNHPVRRRIIMALMLIGNTGIVLGASLMVALLLGGHEHGVAARWRELAMLMGGLVLLYLIARSRWVERIMARFIERLLERGTDLASRDWASVLRLSGDYRVVEMQVSPHGWIAGRTLAELELSKEGVLVLGVTHEDGRYEGAPRGGTRIEAGDVLLVYGTETRVDDLDRRRAGVGGELGHVEAVVEQEAIESEEEADGTEPDARK